MKAFWWKSPDYPNLGDELTPIILERLFDTKLVYSDLPGADLRSTGSTLGWILSRKDIQRARPMAVVGSGFMHTQVAPTVQDFVDIYSVRGFLSRNHLNNTVRSEINIGDPGILAALAANTSPSRAENRLGVILHHSHNYDDSLIASLSHLSPKFIDIRTNDLDKFCSELASCEMILSETLHGLIIADSLHIPNAWLNLGSLHPGGSFKYYDYFSTVGRPFYQFVNQAPADFHAIEEALFLPSIKRVKDLQCEVLHTFERMLSDWEKRKNH